MGAAGADAARLVALAEAAAGLVGPLGGRLAAGAVGKGGRRSGHVEELAEEEEEEEEEAEEERTAEWGEAKAAEALEQRWLMP